VDLPMSGQAKRDQPSSEYSKFEDALKSVLSVSHSELQKKIKESKKRKKIKSSASRVSSD
jgi:hypothetical protein